MRHFYHLLYRLPILSLLILSACQSEPKMAESSRSISELRTELSTEQFIIKDIYQNIQKGETIASIYAVTTELQDLKQMESYAEKLSQSGEKYFIVYFLDAHESTDSIDMKGVLLDPSLRPHCKAIFERTPGVESFTTLPFDS